MAVRVAAAETGAMSTSEPVMTLDFGPALPRRRFLAWLAAAGTALPARSRSTEAPALMLAREAAADVDPAGYLVSEKFDGVRALWDGRALRFRSGLPVAAPAWFVERLPRRALDGELWLGRGRFEALSGIVRRALPVDSEWRELRYQLFDLPGVAGPFAERAASLQALATSLGWPVLQAVEQRRIDGRAALRRRLDEVVNGGGEGLMLHRADALWQPGRSDALLKLKPLSDAEAVVVGHVAGRGRHEGRLGALRVRTDEGIEFLIGTGFTDAQRERPPEPGVVVTYAYRGVTAAGVPRFASFVRVREL
jgi:DNA ligase-1